MLPLIYQVRPDCVRHSQTWLDPFFPETGQLSANEWCCRLLMKSGRIMCQNRTQLDYFQTVLVGAERSGRLGPEYKGIPSLTILPRNRPPVWFSRPMAKSDWIVLRTITRLDNFPQEAPSWCFHPVNKLGLIVLGTSRPGLITFPQNRRILKPCMMLPPRYQVGSNHFNHNQSRLNNFHQDLQPVYGALSRLPSRV